MRQAKNRLAAMAARGEKPRWRKDEGVAETPLGNVFMATMKGGTEADAEQALYHDIWEEILRGDHDTSDGHAPDSVGQDIEGNWFVSYPPIVDGGIRWENKVRGI